MKDLTTEQLKAIYCLEDSPLISETMIQRNNGLTRITIESAVGVDWDGPFGVDNLLVNELDELFPDIEYAGTSAKHTNPMTGIDEEIYHINCDGETLIRLVMRLDPIKSILQREA